MKLRKVLALALAGTMVMKPKILLLDEPLSALDGVIKESIKEKIVTIAKDFHLTTIIVTHDPEEALTISDKVLIINKGNIEQFGTPDEIINSPASDFVNDFILKQLTIKKNNIFIRQIHIIQVYKLKGMACLCIAPILPNITPTTR